jgi:hypothetical protein
MIADQENLRRRDAEKAIYHKGHQGIQGFQPIHLSASHAARSSAVEAFPIIRSSNHPISPISVISVNQW